MRQRMERTLQRLLVCVGALVLTASAAGQTTIFVDASAPLPGDGTSWNTAFLTITEGVAAAQPGDQVWVASGRYKEQVTLTDGIEIYGGFAGDEEPATFDLDQRDFDANETVVWEKRDPPYYPGWKFRCPEGVTSAARIDGFTVTGDAWGIYCIRSSPIIANNRLVHNTSNAIYAVQGAPTIVKNRIAYTLEDADHQAGAVRLFSTSARVIGNEIVGNCLVSGYRSEDRTGGGIFIAGGSPYVADNLIAGNGARLGGGVYISGANAKLINNTIIGNEAYKGAGIYIVRSGAGPRIANTIVAFNGDGIYLSSGSGNQPNLYANCVYGNTRGDYVGLTDPTGTAGNIALDPRLGSAAFGNWHLQPDSPCLDAGDNAQVTTAEDLDGEPRLQGASGLVDIGADEADGTAWIDEPGIVVHVSPTGHDSADGTTWATAVASMTKAADMAGEVGGEIWVQAGTYSGNFEIPPFVYIYGGFAGTELTRDERDWTLNKSELFHDRNADPTSFADFLGGHRVSRLDGLSFTGSYGGCDGMVVCSYCSPTITNNYFTGGATDFGGAIFLKVSWADIVGNEFHDNFGQNGGAIMSWTAYPFIARNKFTNNDSDYGGGIDVWYRPARIVDNHFERNRGFGSHVRSEDSGSVIEGNSMLGATSASILVDDRFDGPPTSVVGNTIIGSKGSAAIMLFDVRPGTVVTNNLLAYSKYGVDITHADAFVAQNCIYGSRDGDYSFNGDVDPALYDKDLLVDPRFVEDPTPGADGEWGTDDDYPGDVHLQAGSPCINAGDDSYVTLTGDFDGNSRHVGCFVDIGAFEHQTVVPLPADFDDDCAISLADYDVFELCLYASGPGSEPPFDECLTAFDLDRDTDIDLADFAAFARVFDGA